MTLQTTQSADTETVTTPTWCVCQASQIDDGSFMVGCEICDEWFHGACVDVTPETAIGIIEYHCPKCAVEHGPSKMTKKRRSERRINTTLDSQRRARYEEHLATRKFTRHSFPVFASGEEFGLDYIVQHGFETPILFESAKGLDMRMPNPSITVPDIARMTGDVPIEVMDVAAQESQAGWTMYRWAQYFAKPKDRRQLLNVISFEISETPLNDLITRPKIVQQLDWIDQYWPTELKQREFPKVQLYCLMSPGGCWTDFHIDFGGTSVFYHLLSGEKVFYMIPPTQKNLAKYERWCKSADQNEVFFDDLVSTCYEVRLKAGMTMLIPSGWIHGVYTPSDSIVIGGNYLHSFSVDLQLSIYQLEDRCNTPQVYRFPYFEKLNWFAAEDLLKRLGSDATALTDRELEGAEALADFFHCQTRRLSRKKGDKREEQERSFIRESIPHNLKSPEAYTKLLSEMSNRIATEKIRRAISLGEPKNFSALLLTYPHRLLEI